MKNLMTVEEVEKLLEEKVPAFKAAKKRAEELSKTFQFNEVIKMLDELIAEVGSMHIAERFSAGKKIFSSTYGDEELVPGYTLNPVLRGMTEKEYKKWQLVHDLTELKVKVVGLAGHFKEIVIDIEATKID